MGSRHVWVRVPQKVKLDANVRERILEQVKKAVESSSKLKRRISRVYMRGNWVYLYELFEQFIPEGMISHIPLIDGKYIECPYARITIFNPAATNCNVDWQRHNDQWMTIYKGTLEECLTFIEDDECWFDRLI
jgi:hypothetical protein